VVMTKVVRVEVICEDIYEWVVLSLVKWRATKIVVSSSHRIFWRLGGL
jgi:hypothetical protein